MSTPGKTLVEALSRQLAPHMVWDESELVTLGMIEAAADRLAVLRTSFDAAATNPDTSASALASLSAECRLSEGTIARGQLHWTLTTTRRSRCGTCTRRIRDGIRTVAHSRANADATLRTWLIEQRSEFRNLMARTLLEDSTESAEYAFRECSKGVDPLIAGEAVRLSRYELPPGHPLSAPAAGHPCDSLELGADDVLRLA